MKRFVAIVFILCSICAFSQNISPKYDRRNIGLAKELVGEVTVLGIFMDENGYIEKKMKQDYIKQLEEAERWIIREARRYRKTVSFTNYYLGRETTITYNPSLSWHYEPPYDIITAAFGRPKAAYQWFAEHPNCAVILFTQHEEFCNARPANHTDTSQHDRPITEIARIFEYDMNEKSTEIAHEMLHLFGAWDLYNTTWYKEGWKTYIDQITTDCNSIMYDVLGKISNHHIDELNAFMIGWSDEWKDWYAYFQN